MRTRVIAYLCTSAIVLTAIIEIALLQMQFERTQVRQLGRCMRLESKGEVCAMRK